MQANETSGRFLRHFKRCDADAPTRFARRRAARDDVTARSNESAGDAVSFQDHDSFVRGVAFSDAAEVKLHSRLQELGGAGAWVEPQLFMADETQGAGQAFWVRQLVLAARPPPELDKWSHRDVKCAAGLLGHVLRFLENAE